MKSNKALLKAIEDELNDVFSFSSDDEKIQFEAEMIHLNTMKSIERLMKAKNMQKKDLAKSLSISQSYITQLFTGDKLINFKMLAKIQRVFNITFNMDVTENESFVDATPEMTPSRCKIYYLDPQPRQEESQFKEEYKLELAK